MPRDIPGGAVAKNSPDNAGDTGSIPGPGWSHTLPRNEASEPHYWHLSALGPHAATREAAATGAHTARKSSPRLLQLEKARAEQQGSSKAKKKETPQKARA